MSISANIVKISYFFGIILVLTLLMSACQKSTDNISQMTVDFSWVTTEDAGSISPEIKLTGVPEATKQFLVELKDLDCSICNHGSDYVNFTGDSIIKKGTLRGDYVGPRPPPGRTHTYEFTVKALNENGDVIGIGNHTGRYPFD